MSPRQRDRAEWALSTSWSSRRFWSLLPRWLCGCDRSPTTTDRVVIFGHLRSDEQVYAQRMSLAGAPVDDKLVLTLVAKLRDAGLDETGDGLRPPTIGRLRCPP